MHRSFRYSALCCVALAALTLSACNVTTPSQVTTGQIRVEDYTKTVLFSVKKVDKDAVDIAAADYLRNSKSRAEIVVPYLKGRKGALAQARRTGVAFKKAFLDYGVDARVNFAETLDEEGARHAVLAYTATMARPPAHCQRMPGQEGAEIQDTAYKYSFGCENATILAKMISRPEDLMGVAGTPDSFSRREGPMMEGYMSGRTNPSIQGVTNSSGAVSGGGVSTGQPTTQ